MHKMDEDRTPLHIYLREIGPIRLLTPNEEIALAKKIKKGDEIAREEMITANLRLVVKIAMDYESYGVALLDLISEGNIGLMKAVDHYDLTKTRGAKFSTYGSWWIKQAIKRALSNQSKTIRLPVHVVDKIAKIRRESLRLAEELGREPTDDELAEKLDLDPSKVTLLKHAQLAPVPLDQKFDPDDGDNNANIGDITADDSAPLPSTMLIETTEYQRLREFVDKLGEREAMILRLRFGLDGDNKQTLEQVSKVFHLTRERIRQLEAIAIRKLRRMLHSHDKSGVVLDPGFIHIADDGESRRKRSCKDHFRGHRITRKSTPTSNRSVRYSVKTGL